MSLTKPPNTPADPLMDGPRPPQTARERGMKFTDEQLFLTNLVEQGALVDHKIGWLVSDYITRHELMFLDPIFEIPLSVERVQTMMSTCQNLGWLKLDPKINGKNWETAVVLTDSGRTFALTGDDPVLDQYMPPAENEPEFHPMNDITIVSVQQK